MAEPSPIFFPTKKPPPNPNPKTFISKLPYKPILIIILIALLPLAPETLNHSLLTRSWELIHLLLVGIAISYGLFSRRNSNPDAEPSPTHESVTKLLHISSVFDDEDPDHHDDQYNQGEKIQTWSSQSQYQSVSPVVVVNDDDHDLPLSLPVRTLKSVSSGNGETAVLPSPIPWRSRSGRMEVRDDVLTGSSSTCSSATPVMEVPSSKREETVKKKRFYKSTMPPAPPPPPPLPRVTHLSSKPIKSLKEELKDRSTQTRRKQPAEMVDIAPPTPPRSVRTVRWKEEVERIDPVEEPPLKLNEEVIVTSDDDSDDTDTDSDAGDNDDDNGEGFVAEDASSSGKDENEVDKLADEFIAKFREQIRLQRIESIKRTTGQKSVKKV